MWAAEERLNSEETEGAASVSKEAAVKATWAEEGAALDEGVDSNARPPACWMEALHATSGPLGPMERPPRSGRWRLPVAIVPDGIRKREAVERLPPGSEETKETSLA
jgi:hypothetical protein